MDPASPNPSATQRITGEKLAVGLALLTAAFLAFWANRVGFPFMNLIGFFCITAASWSINPLDAKQPIKLRELAILLIGLLIVVGLMILLKIVMTPRVEEWFKHPAILLTGWLLCCGALLFRWWKVRNNPLPDVARDSSAPASPENW